MFKNKGMFFEELINLSILHFNQKYNAFFKKRSVEVDFIKVNGIKVSGRLKQKSEADYYGFYVGHYFDFEAKQTKQDFFYLKQLKQHQLEHLLLIYINQGYSFLLINFVDFDEIYGILINDLVKHFYRQDKKRIDLSWLRQNAIKINIVFPGIIDFHHLLNQIVKTQVFENLS